MIHQLDVIEDDTDAMQIELRQQLMAIEGDLNPVDIMFLYKIFEHPNAVRANLFRQIVLIDERHQQSIGR